MGIIKPPTVALRREWNNLRTPDRLRVLDLILEGIDRDLEGARQKLFDIGLSEDLIAWLLSKGQELRHEIRANALQHRIEQELPRTPLERFNSFLVTLVIFLLALTWLAQETIYLQTKGFPIALPFAALFTFVSSLVLIRAFRKWLRALREK